jgi:DNA-binding transcriptional MerR regulator
MPDGRLLTMREIARELGLPESTVRYYRDAFAGYLPAVGTGRRRRYPLEAIPLLRVVAEGYAQNRARTEIEHALGELLGGDGAAAIPAAELPAPLARAPHTDEILATVLDGERERREVMWQMARELVRLGEAIERQQLLLTHLAERVDSVGRALPAAGTGTAPHEGDGAGDAAAAEDAAAAGGGAAPAPPDDELEALRLELARERDLVERLRRSRLDFERRAAEAEAKLDASGAAQRQRGLLGKFRAPDAER